MPTRPAAQVAPAYGGPRAACAVKGTFPGPKGTSIFDAPSGGRAVATFTGARSSRWRSATSPPIPRRAGPASARRWGAARSASRAGWRPRRSPCSRPATSPSQPGHVWISDAQRVRLVPASSGAPRRRARRSPAPAGRRCGPRRLATRSRSSRGRRRRWRCPATGAATSAAGRPGRALRRAADGAPSSRSRSWRARRSSSGARRRAPGSSTSRRAATSPSTPGRGPATWSRSRRAR